jgi:hypothetical protein
VVCLACRRGFGHGIAGFPRSLRKLEHTGIHRLLQPELLVPGRQFGLLRQAGQEKLACRFRILDSRVPMVQAAKDRMRNNVSEPLDRARVRSVFPERNVSSPFVIIGRIFCKNSAKVLGVEHNQMIRAFASDRPDQAFDIPILPGRAERRGPVPNTHRSDPKLESHAK